MRIPGNRSVPKSYDRAIHERNSTYVAHSQHEPLRAGASTENKRSDLPLTRPHTTNQYTDHQQVPKIRGTQLTIRRNTLYVQLYPHDWCTVKQEPKILARGHAFCT